MLTGNEAALIENHLLAWSPDAIILVDQSERILRANTLAGKLFGYEPESLVGQPLSRLFPGPAQESPPLGTSLDTRPGGGQRLWGRQRNGCLFAAEIRLQCLPTSSGTHSLLAVRDLSDFQSRLEALAQQLETQARELKLVEAERQRQSAGRTQAELSYRQLVENQPDLICRFLPDTTLTFVNTAYADFFGQRPEELIGRRFIEFLGAEDQERIPRQLLAMTPDQPERQYEHMTLRADGTPRWHLWHDFAQFDEPGELLGFQSIGIDVTDRRQAEILCRESEERYRQLFELGAEAMFLFDTRSCRILEANQTAVALYGYSRDELLRMKHVDLSAEPTATQDSINRRDTCVPLRRHRKQGGQNFPAEITARHLEYHGRQVILATIRDISERLQAQQEIEQQRRFLHSVIDAAPHLIYVKDLNNHLILINRSLAGRFRLSPEAMIRAEEVCLKTNPGLAQVLFQDDAAILNQEQEGIEREVEYQDPDGSRYWLSTRKAQIRHADGEVQYLIGVGSDITRLKQVEQTLRESEYFLNKSQEVSRIGSYSYNPTTGEWLSSATLDEIFGIGPDYPKTVPGWIELIHPDHKEELSVYLSEYVIDQHHPFDKVYRIIRVEDGAERWVDGRGELEFDDSGRTIRMIGTIQDITERKRAEEALFQAKERAQVTLHCIGDAVITTEAQALVEYLNPVAERLTGWSNAEAVGRPLDEVFQIFDEADRPAANPVQRCLRAGDIPGTTSPIQLRGRHGQRYDIKETTAPIRHPDGRLSGAVLVFHDVSESRRQARQLEHDATHDALTGLINRVEFERRLDRALESARLYDARHALCYLDLDQFKVVNDSAGHAAGDELLKQINGLLSGMFRERDTLARIGGDEFGLLLDNCPLERAQSIAEAVITSVRDFRFYWEGNCYQIGVSIGLVPITAQTRDTARLLSQADAACFTAKELGRNQVSVQCLDEDQPKPYPGEILRLAGLQEAMEQNRFRLHYQPILSLQSLVPECLGYEVLLRVAPASMPPDGPEGLVVPAAFIPIAERYGLMGAIDRWVIREAFRRYRDNVGRIGATLSINLSGRSISDPAFIDFIESQYAEHNVQPGRVCFEITENALIQNPRRSLELMTTLKGLGSQLALDDVGSGLSSLRSLRSLPIDYLKIDGGFTRKMIEQAEDGALVAAINQMGHAMGMRCIAEYAESLDIVERLRELGVDYAQGYFLGPPSPWAGWPRP